MKKKHILYILITLIIAIIAYAAGYITGEIRVQKAPEEDSYFISSAASERGSDDDSNAEAQDNGDPAPEPSEDPAPSEPQVEIDDPYVVPEDAVSMYCRVITVENNGWMLLAEIGENGQLYQGSIYYQSVKDIPIVFEDPEIHELQAGMEIRIAFSGVVAESYPGILGPIYRIDVLRDGMDTRLVQYLQVLNDLWDEDAALNHDISKIGIDLSQTSLSHTERMAVAWVFGQEHGLPVIEGTFEELVDQGYIDGENLYWEDGCLFSIRETGVKKDRITFEAEKWRSGLGAIFFTDCKIIRSADGIWTDYEVGGWAIS